MIKIKHKYRIKTTKGPLGLTKLCAQNFGKENSKKKSSRSIVDGSVV